MFAFRNLARSRIHKAFFRLQSTSAAPPRPSKLPLAVGVGAASFALGWYGPQGFNQETTESTKATLTTRSDAPPALDTQTSYPFGFLTPPTPSRVTEMLNHHTWSVSVPSGTSDGVTRYDGSQLPSNSPCEDRYVHGSFPSPSKSGKDWMAFGVFDGHVGGETAQALTQYLVPYVHHALQKAAGTLTSDTAIHDTIRRAFVSLDDAFVLHVQATMDSDLPWAEKILRITPGSNGSCALLSLYDPSSRKLHVACTGDSRAVLGRLDTATGKWEAIPLSADQTGKNPAELERLKAEHPGEDLDKLVKNGRILGLAVTRGFGDGHWKWPLSTLAQGKEGYFADTFHKHDPEVYKTPPYLTADPVVTTTVLEKGQPAFMIMASDGLWDATSNQQAVDLVVRWLEWRAKGSPAPEEPAPDKFGKFDWSMERKNGWSEQDAKLIVKDDNAAVHITRNALGGAHHDMISGVLALKPPFSRWARDDITIQVVFFNC